MKKIPVSQYARYKGVSPQSVHKRIKKGTLAGGKEEDGLVYVHVEEEFKTKESAPPEGVGDNPAEMVDNSAGVGVVAAITLLSQQLSEKDRQIAEKDRLMASIVEQIQQKDIQISRLQLNITGFQTHLKMLPKSVLDGVKEAEVVDINEEEGRAADELRRDQSTEFEAAQKKTPQNEKRREREEKREREKRKNEKVIVNFEESIRPPEPSPRWWRIWAKKAA